MTTALPPGFPRSPCGPSGPAGPAGPAGPGTGTAFSTTVSFSLTTGPGVGTGWTTVLDSVVLTSLSQAVTPSARTMVAADSIRCLMTVPLYARCKNYKKSRQYFSNSPLQHHSFGCDE